MAAAHWREPDQGIWEIRLPPRHNTHSKLMCWAALDRALRLHDRERLPIDRSRMAAQRDEIRADIDAHGFDARLGRRTHRCGTCGSRTAAAGRWAARSASSCGRPS
jgi:GH15 family glucan-1,4-alpha-glucosidase